PGPARRPRPGLDRPGDAGDRGAEQAPRGDRLGRADEDPESRRPARPAAGPAGGATAAAGRLRAPSRGEESMQPGCAVVAHGSYRATLAEATAGRRAGAAPPVRPAGGPALRTADEQTVAGLSALLGALEAQPDGPDWGVVAAPRYLGRLITATALER